MINMFRNLMVSILCIGLMPAALATEQLTDTVIGKSIAIFSKSLNEQRQINIYLPDSYDKENKDYPVLYVLDGQWHFLNAVAIQKSLKSPLATPEMIVVGVINKNPDRRTWFGGKSDKFEQYLLNELIPYVDSNYRTEKRRILFGWEMGAFFASDVYLKHPGLFEGIVLSNGGEIGKDALKIYESQIQTKKYLYIANSQRDVYTIRFGKALSKTLSESDIKKLDWQYVELNDETHQSTPYLALYKGLKHIFHNFTLPEFIDIKDFKQRGGMKYLAAYFNERAERFGFSPEIDDKTKNHLIWLSWKQNNFAEFDEFMSVFSGVLDTKRYQSVFWYNNFGEFYLKHGNLNKAEDFFKKGLSKFKLSDKLHHGLGKVYKSKGDISNAKKHFNLAIEIAITNKSNKVEQYKKALQSLKSQN